MLFVLILFAILLADKKSQIGDFRRVLVSVRPEIRFRSGPAKYLNIDRIQPHFILISTNSAAILFSHLNIVLSYTLILATFVEI